ncbi:hypothetical protein PVAP13_3KG114027 [Panicum virgatum]|uniref:Uncharacterized protein n=1 Tax=Panicum virgatum TaxID=38727 RepID=A0A8T0UQ91_PANVG|nr:hypothetical protein PVAP13_3KG114027 [Panicum virgatum]
MTWRADWASLSFMHLSFLSPPLLLSLPPILSPCADGSHPPSLPTLAPLVPSPATSSPLCSAFALAAAALRLRTRRRAPPPHSPWYPAPILAAAPGLRARRGAPPPSSPPRPTSALAAAPLHDPCRGAPPPSLPRHPPWCAAACGFRRRQGQRERRRGGGGRRACPVGLEGAWTRPRSSVPAGPTRGQGPHRTGALRGGHRRAPASAHAVAPAELAPPPNPAPRPSLSLELLHRVWRPGCRAPIELRAWPSSTVGPWCGSSSRRHSSLRSMAAAAMAYARAGPWHGGGLPAPVLPPDPVLSVRRRASSRTSYQRGRRGAGWRLQRVPRARGYPAVEETRSIGAPSPRSSSAERGRGAALPPSSGGAPSPRSSPAERGRGARRTSGAAWHPCLEEEERLAPSQRATSALAAHMDTYGPPVNDLKSLGTQKCTFGVDGPI